MAEEDLIFGKNRHFFGGIEPSNMINFSTVYDAAARTISLNIGLPKDTVIDGQTLCSVAGAVIRKSTDGYPENEFDGDFVMDVTSDGIYLTESDVEYNSTYYYSAFPYSKQGVYNRNEVNRLKCVAYDYYLFGFDIDLTNTDPDGSVTYPSDVDNETFEPAYMNFSTGKFNYGSWSSEAGDFNFMPRPVVLKSSSDGTVEVAGYLDADDYTAGDMGSYITGGMDSSDAIYNAMMEWPKIYVKRTLSDDVYSFRCSNKKIDSSYTCYNNMNVNGAETDHFYTPIYCGSKTTIFDTVTVALRSISGTSPENNTTFADYNVLTQALNLGDQTGWDMEKMMDRCLIQDLLILMSKSRNTQDKYGKGYTYASSLAILNGSMNTKGLFWGESAGTSGVKVFGMENWWGAVNRATSGLYKPADASFIYTLTYPYKSYTVGSKTNFSHANFTYPSSGYIYSNSSSGGYIDESKGMERRMGRIAFMDGNTSTDKGSATTYECDYAAFSHSSSYDCFALCGGDYNDKDNAGAFNMQLLTSSNTSGGALSFRQ